MKVLIQSSLFKLSNEIRSYFLYLIIVIRYTSVNKLFYFSNDSFNKQTIRCRCFQDLYILTCYRILFDKFTFPCVKPSTFTEGNFTARRYSNELFMYSHPLLLVQRISIREIDDVVDEQVGQQFSPDQLVNGSPPSVKKKKKNIRVIYSYNFQTSVAIDYGISSALFFDRFKKRIHSRYLK